MILQLKYYGKYRENTANSGFNICLHLAAVTQIYMYLEAYPFIALILNAVNETFIKHQFVNF